MIVFVLLDNIFYFTSTAYVYILRVKTELQLVI